MSVVMQVQTQYRPMLKSDVGEIMAIETVNFPFPWTRGNFIDSLNSGYSCWVLESHGEIIGYAVLMMVLDEVHLLNISVAQAYQGKGIGRELLSYMMQVGREHGGLNMFLEVRVSNTRAIGLYENMGFNEMAVRRNYYPAHQGREDAILMGMAL